MSDFSIVSFPSASVLEAPEKVSARKKKKGAGAKALCYLFVCLSLFQLPPSFFSCCMSVGDCAHFIFGVGVFVVGFFCFVFVLVWVFFILLLVHIKPACSATFQSVQCPGYAAE